MEPENRHLDLSKYQKLILIESGGFGTVYKVKEKATGQFYAAKVSKQEISPNSQEMLYLSREININGGVMHPSILKFIGYSDVDFNNDPKPVIITEFAENGSLSQAIELERRSLASLDYWNDTKKLIIIYGIASGMKYLHSHEILHRDLKPGNILMDSIFLPKIGDFGLSKKIETKTDSKTPESAIGTKGTDKYLPPESHITQTQTKSGDVFAFGLIVYELLTTKEPFENMDSVQIFNELQNNRYPPFDSTIDDSYRDLVQRCLNIDPEKRPTFDQIVSELETNHSFILPSIIEDDYLDYIEFIKNSPSEYNDKRIIKLENFVRNPDSKTFKKIDILDFINQKEIEKLNFDELQKIKDLHYGPHGFVSLYDDQKHSRKIVVKTLFGSNVNDEKETEKAFINEVNALVSLKHPCILPIVGYYPPIPSTNEKPATQPMIGTIYAENGSLEDILTLIEKGQKPSFVDDTWLTIIIVGIVIGMKYIHSNNWIYRDLKPSNILIDKKGYPLIGDLGSSRLVDLSITYTKMVGSPLYMAPEMYDEGKYSSRVDSYSFALLLYELIVGKPVFDKNIQPLPLMKKVCSGIRPIIPDSIHPEIKNIISRCWEVLPDQRLSFNEIYKMLENINFKITPNVDCERVLKYINEVSIKNKIDINLLNGQLLSLEVNEDDLIYDIRKKVSEYTGIPVPYVILTKKGKPLSCCWHHTLDKESTLKYVFNGKKYLILDMCYSIHACYLPCDPDYKPLNTDTYFFILPGTLKELFNEITNLTRNLWFLNNCSLKVLYKNENLLPSDETMLEKGIESGAFLEVFCDNKSCVYIDDFRMDCNLNNPVNELILRYILIKKLKVDKFPFLEKNGSRINENGTLSQAGIVSGDSLKLKFIESNCVKSVVILSGSDDNLFYFPPKLQIPPNETFGSLKRNIILATKSKVPIGTFRFPPPGFNDDDQINKCQEIMDSRSIMILKKK